MSAAKLKKERPRHLIEEVCEAEQLALLVGMARGVARLVANEIDAGGPVREAIESCNAIEYLLNQAEKLADVLTRGDS